MSRSLRARVLVPALVIVMSAAAVAATLKPETVATWQAYVRTTHSRMQERVLSGRPLLLMDEKAGMAEKVRRGRPIVLPMGQTPEKVPDGLIHDWIGTAFIPSTNIEAVLSTVRDYRHYNDFYGPAVMSTKLLHRDGLKDRFSMLLTSNSLGVKSALDGDYTSTYVKVDDRHWYSISETTRLQEVEHYGTPQQAILDENEGKGLIWKLLSVTCFEERDDGVYVELEAVALSRDIPGSLRWVVTSVVRRVSKASLVASLQQTSDAVHSRKPALVQTSGRQQHASPSLANNGPVGVAGSFR